MSNKRKGLKPFLECIGDNMGTGVGEGNSLLDKIHAVIPSNLVNSVIFARLDGDTVHVVALNGGAASRLRFCQRPILEACTSATVLPRALKVSVAPPGTKKQETAPALELRKSQRQAQGISSSAASQLRQAASVIEDKTLRRAIERLARHAEK